MAKIGRPKGSKNKPKWLKEALALNKRPKGRPKGSKNKPKTIPDLVAQALQENAPAKPKLPAKKATHKRHDGSAKLNSVPPEVRSERARKAALAGIAKRRALGVSSLPKGWTIEHAIVVNEMAKEHTKRMIEIMADAGVLPEDEGAQEAMGTVLGIMRTTASNDMKLKAARTVLEYTKSKPSAKVDHTIRTAEDFLDELADKEDDQTE